MKGSPSGASRSPSASPEGAGASPVPRMRAYSSDSGSSLSLDDLGPVEQAPDRSARPLSRSPPAGPRR